MTLFGPPCIIAGPCEDSFPERACKSWIGHCAMDDYKYLIIDLIMLILYDHIVSLETRM